ncbi:MAG TPA: aminotransferase class I/II-fold pyridoxal phosphate-dependent enzyme [Terriglobales bacterium]|nr:aminotransferase class I/II-fold pyridoxal phosphate-dependent enzyme [Terriglobales bacterium]
MKQPRGTIHSPYMEWAKLCSAATYNLATSGVASYPLAELGVSIEDLEINGPSEYGYPPLQERLARKNQVAPECVVAAAGTSMANHLAMAACFEPGEEVLVEQPTYELLLSTARYLGAKIRRFRRSFEDDFRIDPQEIAKRITPRTRLIMITNLHNPSGALTDEPTLAAVGEIAQGCGARVLVDEVYLEAAFEAPRRSAFHLGPQFVTTNSLTKAYGLSGLRCGWVLAEPELAKRMWRINDVYGATAVHPGERMSVMALDRLETISGRAKNILGTNRQAMNALLDARRELRCFRPAFGTVMFPKLRRGNVDEFCQLLREKYETSVVPGQFFEMPQYLRIGMGGDIEMTAEGLRRLGCALEECARR